MINNGQQKEEHIGELWFDVEMEWLTLVELLKCYLCLHGFDFRAKSSFYSTFETWKEYVISFDNMIGLYEIFKDGSEQELISIQGSLRDATFSTFVEEKIPDIIKLMEEALALDNNFSITRDKDGMYFAWL